MTDSTSSPRRIAVVGGGITGLAAAHRLIELSRELNQSVEVALFESSSRIGGVAGTTRIGDYLVETGADSFITNKPAAVRLCERLGIADRLLKTNEQFRGSHVLRRGQPVPVPEGFMLLTPAKAWPVLSSPLFSLSGKIRMGLEYFIPRRVLKDDDDESLADFVRRRFGQEALERIVQPLVGGIYTSDPERLSLKATLPRFIEQERKFGSLIRAARTELATQAKSKSGRLESGARYSLFTTPEHGVSEIFDTLANRVRSAGALHVQSAVVRLEQLPANRTRLIGASGPLGDFDAVILALPAYHVARLLRSLPAPQADSLGSELEAIEYASTAIVVTGHKLADIKNPLNSFGLVIPAIEKRRVLAVSFSSRKFVGRAPEGRVILRTFVGGAMQPEQLAQTDEDILATVREELRQMLGVHGEPDFGIVVRHERSMPQFHVGHVARVRRINDMMSHIRGIELAGNAYTGVGLPDCIDSGEQAAQRVLSSQQLQPSGP
jgi:oxygen-dependent protoporphyrinogen oxidase